MYIKLVIIEGFKSYNEQTATEDFSSKVNCVVGANGSGKSNFFHAIRFVLSDIFQNLRNEDRNALLHEGVGHQVGSAFVEIVFDNSDNRIPVDKDEIRLRRAIGLKKDEYFLDGKHITKNEVMDLLESAGFSRSNPYYVVQQGKIASLTMMKDSERLDLLKEIGGTRVYEEKRCESLKIMQDTGIKRNHIIQAVQYLDEKLRELDEEKEELRKYQQLDKQRKSLEYTIYEKQLHDTREKLEQTEAERTKASEESTKMYDRVEKAQDECRSLDESLAGLTKELQTMNNKKETVEALKTEAIKKKTKLELDENDLKERIAGNIQSKNDALEQLSMVEREREDSLKELEAITPLYESQVDKEKQTTKRIMELEKKLNILYQKKGRATQFSDKATRDEWLRKETKYLKRVLDSNMGQEQKLQDEIFGLNTDLKERDAHIKNHEVEISELDTHISKSHEQFNIKKRERDEEHRKRREKWGEESQLSSEIDKLKMELERAKKNLDHATPGDVRRGLISIKRICSEHKINGVFGPLVELVDCDEKFFTAVEVTAGNSLFHVVVEDDDISTKIIEHLNSRKGGRVTFIPLNRVNAPHVNYPQCSDAIPLLRRLKFDSKFAPAFGQVFGRTVVCQDLNVATRVAKSDGLDCITLEGDQVSRKGGMTGGFYDHRRSKLRLMNTIIQNMKSIDTKEKVLEDVRRQLQVIYQQITQIVTEKQRLESDWTHSRLQVEQLKQEIANETKQKHAIHIALEHKEKSLGDVRIQMEQLRSSMAMKEAEMATELVDHLTPEETEELSRLNPEIEDLKDKLIAFKTDRIETETRKAELETNLSTNLKRRIDELHATIASVEDYSLPSSAGLETQELDDAKLLVEEFTNELQGLCRSIDEKTKQVKKIKDKKAKLKTLQDDCEMKVQDANKKLEELFSLRNTLLSKQEEYRKKIMGLGPFSSESFDMYKQKNIKELQKVLHGCSEQLQQFSHVNKKALDQYVNFTEQREELQKRKTELDAGDEKIKELITVLDQQKDESIERTYKMVSFHFREIFSQLVQGGHGHLVMMKKTTKKDRDHDDEDGCGEAATERRVEKYDGVTVKVSFTDQGETRSMKQLSGGQKTVVALALIFAIQKCDPAPFYLFDEIDAALDTQYRTAVGNMIRGLADDSVSTQFITTTFRPELVKVADKMYGVFHENNASIVKVISKEQALNFIQNDQSP
ncbi:PREDICTED: structural maintenance of chromosomes protein 3-like [Brassica oleracea var. oleracea]|uniref:structural maintenance of chromosomes protein 3-like n=1 Tax=Brassica oleracea var. oleracea TaxID=109376 RepID=UPI0006A70331|nr:PREDICTED: structural maintenance of chromosomes protein 3-like [Brassica oleracea var. oleracea]